MIRIAVAEIRRAERETRRQAEQNAVARCLGTLGLPDGCLCHRHDGAPFIEGDTSRRVSVTHSRQWAAVALSPETDGPTGIDMEETEREQLRKVCPRILSAEELTAARSAALGFAKAWTAKEAVFKAISCQSVDFKSHILIDKDFTRAVYVPDNTVLCLHYVSFARSNILCIASKDNNFEIITLYNS